MASVLRIVVLQSVLVFLLVAMVTSQTPEPSMVTGVFDGSVTLKCDLELRDPAQVTWRDTVYNTDRNAALIFESENNPNMEFNSEHLNKDHFTLDDKYALTISGLKADDVGLYFCESVVDGATLKKTYNLIMGSEPECTGETDLFEGDKTVLSCSAKLVGNGLNHQMEWFANDEKIGFRDEAEIGIVKVEADIDGTWDKNKVKYTCRLQVGTLDSQCSLTLNVKFLARNIQITPAKKEYRVGDKLKCSADGNPTPSITWSPQGEGGEDGEGWRTLNIKEEWEGKEMSLNCMASNGFGDEKKMLSENVTFTAGKAKEPEPEPKPASSDGNQVAGIVAGLIIGAVVLVIIIIAIVCIRRKQSKKPKGAKRVPTKDEEMNHERHNMDGKGGEPVELTKFQPKQDDVEKGKGELEPFKDSYDDLNNRASNDDTLPIRGRAEDDVDDVTVPMANGNDQPNDGKPSAIDTDDLDALLKDLQNSVP